MSDDEAIKSFISKQPFVTRNRKALNTFFICYLSLGVLDHFVEYIENQIVDSLFALLIVAMIWLLIKSAKMDTTNQRFIYDRVDVYEDSLLFRRNSNKKFDRTNRVSIENIVQVNSTTVSTDSVFKKKVDVMLFDTKFGETIFLSKTIENAKEFIELLTSKKSSILWSQD